MPRPKPIEPKTPVSVRWVDAETLSSAQAETLDGVLAYYKPARRKTIGYYVGYVTKEGERALCIATDDDAREEYPEAVGGLNFIPASMVRGIDIIGAPKRRK